MEHGNSEVIVSISDSGSSIPEESLEQIFEPFFTTKENGLGLGLSVSRTIIAAHRGQLWVTNNLDRGATGLDCAPGQGFDLVQTPDGPAVRFTGACTLQPDDVWDIRYLADN